MAYFNTDDRDLACLSGFDADLSVSSDATQRAVLIAGHVFEAEHMPQQARVLLNITLQRGNGWKLGCSLLAFQVPLRIAEQEEISMRPG